MIGKISIGKDFGGCIRYLLEGRSGEKKEFAEVLHYNNCYGDKNELTQQFRDVKALNHKIEKPVWHTSLSFAHDDKLSKNQMIEIAEKLAKKFGFENNQYLVVQHHDTKHQHIHIVTNRVGYDRKAIATSMNYQKISEFNRSIEKEYNLEQVLAPRKFLDKEQIQIPRLDKRKDHIKEILNDALSKSKNLNEFKSFVEQKNIKVEIGRGIAFIDNKGVKMKGSQIGFSLLKLNKLLSLTQIYKPEIIIKKIINKALDYER